MRETSEDWLIRLTREPANQKRVQKENRYG
jgi:hypothetical protein